MGANKGDNTPTLNMSCMCEVAMYMYLSQVVYIHRRIYNSPVIHIHTMFCIHIHVYTYK